MHVLRRQSKRGGGSKLAPQANNAERTGGGSENKKGLFKI